MPPQGLDGEEARVTLEVDTGDFLALQREDPSLQHAWENALETRVEDEGTQQQSEQGPHFEIQGDRLYRVPGTAGGETQLLVPKAYRWRVMEMAHDNPWAGHLGIEKTQQRVIQRFYWPGVYQDVKNFCRSCPQCQRTAEARVPRAALVPMPLVSEPFERIGLDLVGPLERTRRGHQYILVVVDYATRYPEAVPLRKTNAATIADELVKMFARVGLPKEILTDQGTNLVSRLMKELCRWLQIKKIRTAAYHPQTDGLVERFNKTLKAMLRRLVQDDPRDWDKLLPPLLFAIREVPQSSVGFSPFELLYGRRPRGILDLVREGWEEQASTALGAVQYVIKLRDRMRTIGRWAQENLKKAQETQARHYNTGTRLRVFHPGDPVLVLLPAGESKLLAKWQGPYRVTKRIGEVDYEVQVGGKHRQSQVYHVNLLKRWVPREEPPSEALSTEIEFGPWGEEEVTWAASPMGRELNHTQQAQLRAVLQQAAASLTSRPGRTTRACHEITTEPGSRVRDPVRPIPRKLWDTVQKELQDMLRWGVVEKSRSEWRSPIVLVPKKDGAVRFCIDFRKLNAVSKFDAYPMPRVDELLERLGRAEYLSTIDLTKGYWQIPLTPAAREKTAFATPFGLFQFVTMPFGLHGAAATFQRLMDEILEDHRDYATAYIDDIVVFSRTWEEHLQQLGAVLRTLQRAGLTANPKKCQFGKREVSYLGYTVGRGRLKPLLDKVCAIRDYPRPHTKRQVRQFLGLAGYYRRFIKHFASLAAPLTDLTKKEKPQRVVWTPQGVRAFEALRQCLVSGPVLRSPDFEKPFLLQTDASEVGLGAVLAQEEEGAEYPVAYLSRKLFPRERNYAVIEKEALAIKWAIDSLRYFLTGNTFTLVTDHAPLRWMQSMKDNNARIMRWYLSLQPFRFDIKHRPELETESNKKDNLQIWRPQHCGYKYDLKYVTNTESNKNCKYFEPNAALNYLNTILQAFYWQKKEECKEASKLKAFENVHERDRSRVMEVSNYMPPCQQIPARFDSH
ncbi:uncharacterized protein LOC142826874 [Pelodiscus sinensis]|uniref:uncharacterized protein LOC142826874 n=1 Tax=Pelodiscus sinensis TaxID=13735 RepID=UPI003F6AA99B